MKKSATKRGIAALTAAAIAGTGLVATLAVNQSIAAPNVAGQPGVPSEYDLVFWEGFENRPTDANLQMLSGYVGGAGAVNQGLNNTGITYTSAVPQWESEQYCNGLVMDQNDPRPSTSCNSNQTFYRQLQAVMGVGPFAESPTALAAFTSYPATGFAAQQDQIQIKSSPIAVPDKQNRFLAFGLDAAVIHCYVDWGTHTHPMLAFSYIDGSGKEQLMVDRIDENGNLRNTEVVNGTLPSWMLNIQSQNQFNATTKPATGEYYSQQAVLTPSGLTSTYDTSTRWATADTKVTTPTYSTTKTYYTPTDSGLINPCSDPATARSITQVPAYAWNESDTVKRDAYRVRDVAAGTYISKSAYLNEDPTTQIIVRNRTASGAGNDAAIDNLKIYDVTPQLDVNYGDWDGADSQHEGNEDSERVYYQDQSTITFTITNRSDLGSKYGWSFSNVLPAGLEFVQGATPVIERTGTFNPLLETSATLNQITFDANTFTITDGYLDIGQETISITLPVKNVDPALQNADIMKKYTTQVNSFSNVVGLDLPNPTSIRWYNFTEESSNIQGQPQVVTPKYVNENGDLIEPSATNPAKFLDANGNPIDDTTVPALDENGNPIGTYTIDPATGQITFQPNPDFIGTPQPIKSAVLDSNGEPVVNIYTPTVTPVEPIGNDVTSTGKQGASQTGTPTFEGGDPLVPVEISATNPAKLIDPRTGQVTENTTVPALDENGEQIGTYTIDPATGVVTFQPNPDFVGTPQPAVVEAYDTNGTPAQAKYTPTVTPVTPVANNVSSQGPQGQEQTGTPTFEGGDPDVPVEISATNPAKLIDPATGVATDATTVPALDADGNEIGTYTIDPATGEVTFQPNPDFVGTPQPAKVEAKDKNGTAVVGEYQPHVYPVIPVAQNDETIGLQGQPQTSELVFLPGHPDVPIDFATYPAQFLDADGNPIAETTVPAMKDGVQVGTYTLDPATGQVVFQPNPDFTGTPDPIKVQVKDANGTPAVAQYTPTVNPVVPTGTPDETTGLQGQPQTSELVFTPGDDSAPITITADQPAQFIDPATGQPTTETVLPAMKDGVQVGTYTLDPLTGQVVFQPNPDFVGTPEPITVQVKDSNGTPATATYTPTVTPVKPVGTPVTSEGPQGAAQTGAPAFEGGDPAVPVVISADNPAKLIDPATGQPTNETTINATDADGNVVGTYTIDPATGVVTFQPNPDFVGTPVPATVQAKDANGTPATATYTPTVTPVIPTGSTEATEGKQGQPQTATVTFANGDPDATPLMPSADNPVKLIDPATGQPTDETTVPAMKDGVQVGTYTIDPLTGVITFQPNPDFLGSPDPAQATLKDANGTPAFATYSPTVTPVTPVGVGVTSEGPQGEAQTGTPTFIEGDAVAPIVINADQPAKLIDPATGQPTDETTIPALKDGVQVGTYTIDPLTGVVTFQPNPDFIGAPDAAVVEARDANGTPARATYQPLVIPVIPEGSTETTVGKQGAAQSATVTFTNGDPDATPLVPSADNPAKLVDPATGQPTDATTVPALDGNGNEIGTYTIDPLTGEITFQPNPDFVGTPQPAKAVLLDKNGTPAESTYQPVVTPLTPVGTGDSSSDVQGKAQTGTPTFVDGEGNPLVPSADNPAKLIDPATGLPTDATTIPALKDGVQVGTYTIDPLTGVVTFQPNPDFVGTPDPAQVQVRDANGTPATAFYQPHVSPLPGKGDLATSENVQGKAQTGTPGFTDGMGNPITPSADNPAKLIDPATGLPTDEPTVPAFDKNGVQVGTYTIDPLTGVVTFQPNPDFIGTPVAAKVALLDPYGNELIGYYQPVVTPAPAEPQPQPTPVDPQPEPKPAPVDPTKPAAQLNPAQKALAQTGAANSLMALGIGIVIASLGGIALLVRRGRKEA